MAPMRLYNCTSAFVAVGECVYLLGDNSENGAPDPWQSALSIVHLLGMATDEENDYRGARHYTFRHVHSPQDDHAVKRLLSQQIATAQKQPGNKVDLSDLPYIAASCSAENDGHVILACRVLVDGGDDNSSSRERLRRVPREKWHPYPVPKGISAVGIPGPNGGYVLMEDMPKPVLEEDVIGVIGLRSLPRAREQASSSDGGNRTCELDRLYVEPDEDDSLCYVLVGLMVEYVKTSGYKTVRLAQTVDIEIANIIFEKASVASIGSEASARKVRMSDAGTRNMLDVWEMDLDKWLGSANFFAGT